MNIFRASADSVPALINPMVGPSMGPTIDADEFDYFWHDQTKQAINMSRSYGAMEAALRNMEAKAKGILIDSRETGVVIDMVV